MSHSVQRLYTFCLLTLLSTTCMISAASINADINNGADDESALNLDQKNNYCLQNVTYYEEVPVNKTRNVVVKPTGAFRMFKKNKIQVEEYVDIEKVPHTRLQNDCCEGYAMTANKTCQPVCEPGCPANAFCRAPQMCQCRRGYDAIKSALNGTHYCEPRCASGCPNGGKCVAPELCECAAGYQAKAGSCAPTCASDCLNGRCAALNQCSCNAGYAKDLRTGECVPLDDCGVVKCEDVASSTESTTDYTTLVNSDELDVTEIDLDAGSGSGSHSDGNDYVDEGNVLFPSYEEDTNCTLQPCLGNAVCKLVGRCACADGFIRHQPAPVNGVEVGPICAAVVEQGEPLQVDRVSGDLVGAFFIVVGAIVMMAALVLLLLKLWRHQRGSLDVEGKSDMCCKYEKNSSSSDSGHVDMS
ncbi:uncharacterized protein LOC129249108 [Anastrepha obliqua]|uniref:uncharacterized protein LOC129249108 n=1 Tax=Anastrepha obliqua TaxID=95512 RepID=UPI0024091ABD|nr:uncharacterized protein LOC129249108 [Anastrepha obliqua]